MNYIQWISLVGCFLLIPMAQSDKFKTNPTKEYSVLEIAQRVKKRICIFTSRFLKKHPTIRSIVKSGKSNAFPLACLLTLTISSIRTMHKKPPLAPKRTSEPMHKTQSTKPPHSIGLEHRRDLQRVKSLDYTNRKPDLDGLPSLIKAVPLLAPKEFLERQKSLLLASQSHDSDSDDCDKTSLPRPLSSRNCNGYIP